MTVHSTASRPPPGPPGWRESVAQVHAALSSVVTELPEQPPSAPLLLAAPVELVNMLSAMTRGRRWTENGAAGIHAGLRRWLFDSRGEGLASLFFLTEPLPAGRVQALLRTLRGAPDPARLVDTGVLEDAGGGRLKARLRFARAGDLLVVADPLERSIDDFTYIGGDSLLLAGRLRQDFHGRRFTRALDLCCGSGVQGLTVAQFCDRVEGTDINPRAVAFANLNAALLGMAGKVSFGVGDLADGLDGPYDLIVANPPFVFMTAEEGKTNRDGYGGELGLEIVERILADLNRLLGPQGEAAIVSDSPIVNGQSSLTSLVKRLLAGTGLGATLTALRYNVDRNRAAFRSARGISHVVHYYLRVSRRFTGVRVVERPFMSRLSNEMYSRATNWVYGRWQAGPSRA